MVLRWKHSFGLALLFVNTVLHQAAALEFDMLFQTKCVMEEINKGVLVVGDFAAFDRQNTASMVEITIIVRAYNTYRSAHSGVLCT